MPLTDAYPLRAGSGSVGVGGRSSQRGDRARAMDIGSRASAVVTSRRRIMEPCVRRAWTGRYRKPAMATRRRKPGDLKYCAYVYEVDRPAPAMTRNAQRMAPHFHAGPG